MFPHAIVLGATFNTKIVGEIDKIFAHQTHAVGILKVRNAGSILGDHTVLLFMTDLYRSITPSNKGLLFFYYKLTLVPGERRNAEFQLNRTDLSFIDLDNTRQSEPGLFIVTIGNLQANFTLLATDSKPSSTNLLDI